MRCERGGDGHAGFTASGRDHLLESPAGGVEGIVDGAVLAGAPVPEVGGEAQVGGAEGEDGR